MTFRTKSRERQRKLWALAALTAVALYVGLSFWLYGSVSLNILIPRQHRLFLPVFILFILFVWETRREANERKTKALREKREEEPKERGEGKKAIPSPAPCVAPPPVSHVTSSAPVPRPSVPAPAPAVVPVASPAADGMSGEALYVQARSLPHQQIPDFETDSDYLTLLGRSAEKGYPRALTKLGEYAMRRSAWVEAYYWMWLAQKKGMGNLSGTLREIRRCWAMDGFPAQSSNVSSLFSKKAGSIGRALLGVDSGREASTARAFLRKEAPEYLVQQTPTRTAEDPIKR